MDPLDGPRTLSEWIGYGLGALGLGAGAGIVGGRKMRAPMECEARAAMNKATETIRKAVQDHHVSHKQELVAIKDALSATAIRDTELIGELRHLSEAVKELAREMRTRRTSNGSTP